MKWLAVVIVCTNPLADINAINCPAYSTEVWRDTHADCIRDVMAETADAIGQGGVVLGGYCLPVDTRVVLRPGV